MFELIQIKLQTAQIKLLFRYAYTNNILKYLNMNTQRSFFNIIYVKCIKNGLAQMSKTKITKKNKELNIFKGTGVGTGEGGGQPRVSLSGG